MKNLNLKALIVLIFAVIGLAGVVFLDHALLKRDDALFMQLEVQVEHLHQVIESNPVPALETTLSLAEPVENTEKRY